MADVNRPAQSVDNWIAVRVQQLLTGKNSLNSWPRRCNVVGRSVYVPGIDRAVIVEAIKVEEPKSLLELRNLTTNRKPPIVLAKRQGLPQTASA